LCHQVIHKHVLLHVGKAQAQRPECRRQLRQRQVRHQRQPHVVLPHADDHRRIGGLQAKRRGRVDATPLADCFCVAAARVGRCRCVLQVRLPSAAALRLATTVGAIRGWAVAR